MTLHEDALHLTLSGCVIPPRLEPELKTVAVTKQTVSLVASRYVPEILFLLTINRHNAFLTDDEESKALADPVPFLGLVGGYGPAHEPSVFDVVADVLSTGDRVELAYCRCGDCPSFKYVVATALRALILCLYVLASNTLYMPSPSGLEKRVSQSLKQLMDCWDPDVKTHFWTLSYRSQCAFEFVRLIFQLVQGVFKGDIRSLQVLLLIGGPVELPYAEGLNVQLADLTEFILAHDADSTLFSAAPFEFLQHMAQMRDQFLDSQKLDVRGWIEKARDRVLHKLDKNDCPLEVCQQLCLLRELCSWANLEFHLPDTLVIHCKSCTSNWCVQARILSLQPASPITCVLDIPCKLFDVSVTLSSIQHCQSLVDKLQCPSVVVTVDSLHHHGHCAVYCCLILLRIICYVLPQSPMTPSMSLWLLLLEIVVSVGETRGLESSLLKEIVKGKYELCTKKEDQALIDSLCCQSYQTSTAIHASATTFNVLSVPLQPALLDPTVLETMLALCRQFTTEEQMKRQEHIEVKRIAASIKRASLEVVERFCSQRPLVLRKLRPISGQLVNVFQLLGLLQTSTVPVEFLDPELCCQLTTLCAKLAVSALLINEVEPIMLMAPSSLNYALLLDSLTPFLEFCRRRILTATKIISLCVPGDEPILYHDMLCWRILIVFALHPDTIPLSQWINQREWNPAEYPTMPDASRLCALHRFAERLRTIDEVKPGVLDCVQYLVRYIQLVPDEETIDSVLLLLQLLSAWSQKDPQLFADRLWIANVDGLTGLVTQAPMTSDVKQVLFCLKFSGEASRSLCVANVLQILRDALQQTSLSYGRLAGLELINRALDCQIGLGVCPDLRTKIVLEKLRVTCVSIIADSGVTGARRLIISADTSRLATDCLMKCLLVLQSFSMSFVSSESLIKMHWWAQSIEEHLVRAMRAVLLPLRLEPAGIIAINSLYQHFDEINAIELRDLLAPHVFGLHPFFESDSAFAVAGAGFAYRKFQDLFSEIVSLCEAQASALLRSLGWIMCLYPSTALQLLAPALGSFFRSDATSVESVHAMGKKLYSILSFNLPSRDMESRTKQEAMISLKLIILETIDRLEDWLETLEYNIVEMELSPKKDVGMASEIMQVIDKVKAFLKALPFKALVDASMVCSAQTRALMILERRLFRGLTLPAPSEHMKPCDSIDDFHAGLARRDFFHDLRNGSVSSNSSCLMWCPIWSAKHFMSSEGFQDVVQCICDSGLEPDSCAFIESGSLAQNASEDGWTSTSITAWRQLEEAYTYEDLNLISEKESIASPWPCVTPCRSGAIIVREEKPRQLNLGSEDKPNTNESFLRHLKLEEWTKCRSIAKEQTYALRLSIGAAARDSSAVLERLLERATFWSALKEFVEFKVQTNPSPILSDGILMRKIRDLSCIRKLPADDELARIRFARDISHVTGACITHSWLTIHMTRLPDISQAELNGYRNDLKSDYFRLRCLEKSCNSAEITSLITLLTGVISSCCKIKRQQRLNLNLSPDRMAATVLRLPTPQANRSRNEIVAEAINITELHCQDELYKSDTLKRLVSSIMLAPNFAPLRWKAANYFHDQLKWWLSDERIVKIALLKWGPEKVHLSTTLSGKQALTLINIPTPSSRESFSLKTLALTACVEYLAAAILSSNIAVVCLLRCLQIMMEMCSPITTGSALKQSLFCEAVHEEFCNDILTNLLPDLAAIPAKYWFATITHLVSRSSHVVLGHTLFIPILAFLLIRFPPQTNWHLQSLLNSSRSSCTDIGLAVVDQALQLLERLRNKQESRILRNRKRHSAQTSNPLIAVLVQKLGDVSIGHGKIKQMVDNLNLFVKCFSKMALDTDQESSLLHSPTLSRLYPQLSKLSAELQNISDDVKFVVPVRNQLECILFPNKNTETKRIFADLPLALADIFESPVWLTPPLETASDPEPDDCPFSVEQEIRVFSIDNEIQILKSKQRPKKIVIHGSDGNEYQFLLKNEVKGDLRKDSRIEDFVSTASKWILDDIQTAVTSFSVIPLNEVTGLIEWVSDLQTLRSLCTAAIRSVMTTQTMQAILKEIGDQTKRLRNDPAGLYKLFVDQACPAFPPTLHRYFFYQFGRQPSAWLRSRNKFTVTCAFWSIVGFLTGLGDRHGENLLISSLTGELIHVDFDCLFGKGFALAVPEIVPFRLTQNLAVAMGAVGTEGLFQSTCIKIWRKLRARSPDCLALMNSFIHDPLVEWGDRKGSSRAHSEHVEYGAKQTLLEMSWKLEGNINFSAPFSTELASQPPGSVDVLDMIRGLVLPPQPQWLNQNLNEEEQVKALIVCATCPLNLAMMYFGWMPWM